MTDLKIVTVRLPGDMLEQVDALVEQGYETRTDAIRYLIHDGLSKTVLMARISELEESLSRLAAVHEMTYSMMFAVFSMLRDKEKISPDAVAELMSKAQKAMAVNLIKKFGE